MEIWNDIIDDVKSRGQYDVSNEIDKNLIETYIMLGELLNPSNAYDYSVYQNEIYYFNDSQGNRFCARLVYQPTNDPYFEFKTWWVDNGKAVYHYLPNNSTATDWDKRSDTVAKIFRDEAIPKFKNQKYTNIMKIIPVDSKRYQLSIRMVKKFIPSDWEITENFPKVIIIKKQ